MPFYLTAEGRAGIVGNERAENICRLKGAGYTPDTEAMLHFRIYQAAYTVKQRKQKDQFRSLFRSLANWIFADRIDSWHNLSIAVQ